MSNNTNTIIHEIKKLEPAFIELIRKRFGLMTHTNQASELIKAMNNACNKFNYLPKELLEKLNSCSSNSPLLADLLEAITISESYFFRDKNQMNLLKHTLLPQLIRHKSNDYTLKIWSAGCSSGEEIYTVAMLLAELLPNIEIWDLYLLGTDINTTVLKKAKSGIYGQWSMRSIADKYIKQYFNKNNHSYTLSHEICELVQFQYLNLCDNSYPSVINGIFDVDLILCRNVLIYFDNDLVAKIMKKLGTCMAKHGYLLLGASDPSPTSGTNLVFHHNDAIYFSLN